MYPRDLVTLQITLAVVKRRGMIVVLAVALSGGACSGTDDVLVNEPLVTTSTTNATTSTTTSTTATVPTQASAVAGLGDSFYPYLGNGGYDVLHYEIDLDIDPVAKHNPGAHHDHRASHPKNSRNSTWTCRASQSTRSKSTGPRPSTPDTTPN